MIPRQRCGRLTQFTLKQLKCRTPTNNTLKLINLAEIQCVLKNSWQTAIWTHTTKEADITSSVLQTEKLRLKYVSLLDHLMLLAVILTSDIEFKFKISIHMISSDFWSIVFNGCAEILFWRAKFKSHLCLTLCFREMKHTLQREWLNERMTAYFDVKNFS